VVDPILFNAVYFGLTSAAGETLNSVDEAATPSSGTFTVANGATFSQDLGPLQHHHRSLDDPCRLGAGDRPYAVNTTTGVYTVNTAQNGQSLRASYTYASASTGQSLAFTNQLMGSSVIFSVQLVNKFKGSDGVVRSLFLNFRPCSARSFRCRSSSTTSACPSST